MSVSLEELAARVSALENQLAGQRERFDRLEVMLGRQWDLLSAHTLRLDRIEVRLDGVERTLDQHTEALTKLAEAMTELLRRVPD